MEKAKPKIGNLEETEKLLGELKIPFYVREECG